MRLVFVFLFFCFYLSDSAQLRFGLLSTSQNVPTNETYEAYCDSKGYIWFGHALGISRYNGNKINDYKHPLQNSLGISNIKEDLQGNIWCRNFGGQIFSIVNNKMQLLDCYNWKQQATFPTFVIDKFNRLIASHNKGLFVYNISQPNNNYIVTPSGKPEFLNNFSLGQCNGEAIAIFNSKMYVMGAKQLLPVIDNMQKAHNLSLYSSILSTVKDSIYLLSKNRDTVVVCLFQNKQCNEIRSFACKGILGIYQLKKNAIYLCGKTGVNSSVIKQPLAINNVTSVCEDKDNNIWFTSLQQGIAHINTGSYNSQDISFSLPNNDVMKCITTYKSGYAVGTSFGNLFITSSNKLQVKLYKEPFKTSINVLFNNKNNNLLAGSSYLLKLSNTNTILDTIASVSSVKDIEVDTNKNYYVATSFSLTKILPSGEKIILRDKRCRAVKQCDTTIYAAFADGIFMFNNSGKQELTINKQSIYGVSLCTLPHKIAIATINDGVYVFANNKIEQHFSIDNGLLSNQIKKMLFYNNKLWLLTDKSIEQISTNNTITHYTTPNSFSLTNITDFIVTDSTIVLMGADKLYTLPIQSKISNAKPKLYFDAIVINNNDSIAYKTNSFNYRTNNIQFELSGLSINSGSKLNFAYRLLGAENTWHFVDASQSNIGFLALLPGNYTFEAKAISEDGQVSNILQYSFTISKPWWQQWWFFSMVLLFLIATAYAIIQAKTIAATQRNKLLLEKLNLQSDLRDSMLTAIKSQMNPHFIFNALNTIQSYIYTKDEYNASIYLGKFSDLIRQVLNNSQRKNISLANEISTLQLYVDLELMRFESTLQATITVDVPLNTESILLPPMLVQPYVENAIKHGLLHKANNRILQVSFTLSEDNNFLKITVDDNGIGRAASDKINKQRRTSYQSFSSFANQHRFNLLNQTLSKKISLQIIDKLHEDGEPLGTTVIIKLPL